MSILPPDRPSSKAGKKVSIVRDGQAIEATITRRAYGEYFNGVWVDPKTGQRMIGVLTFEEARAAK